MENSSSFSESKTWLGSTISDICKGQGFWNFAVSPLTPSKYHTIVYQLPADLKHVPKAHLPKSQQENLWDDDNVRMPYSIKNLYPVNEVKMQKNQYPFKTY